MNTLSLGDPSSCKRDYQADRINISEDTKRFIKEAVKAADKQLTYVDDDPHLTLQILKLGVRKIKDFLNLSIGIPYCGSA